MSHPGEQVSEALAQVERLYSADVERHGPSPRSVGWKDVSSQRLRFVKLAQLLAARDEEPITVNDLGCGYGAMFAFLDEMVGVRLGRYYGYDLSEAMLQHAREATDERAQLIRAAAPTHVADYTFASGPFYVKGTATDAAWQEHVQESLRRMAEKSRLGFAFNQMTTFVDFRQENLFYADPGAFFEFCKREISPYVTLVHDYPLYEWTMLVYHRDPA